MDMFLFSAWYTHPSEEEEGRDATDLTEDEKGSEINFSCYFK